MRRASSISSSQPAVSPVTRFSMACDCMILDCSHSGASDRFSIMFCQCMASSVQVPLPRECPALAGSVMMLSSTIANSRLINLIHSYLFFRCANFFKMRYTRCDPVVAGTCVRIWAACVQYSVGPAVAVDVPGPLPGCGTLTIPCVGPYGRSACI